MPLKSIRQKLEWLEEKVHDENLLRLRNCFDSLWKSERTSKNNSDKIPKIFADSVFLDLSYCLFRHLKWCHSKLFQAVITENFILEYSFEKDVFSKYLNEMLICIDPKMKIKVKPDREFLLYILIQTMTSSNEKELLSEIGLGSEILKKLRNAAQCVESTTENPEKVWFLPDIDQMYSDILIELSKELKKYPWQLDAYKLKYSLDQLPTPWGTFVDELNSGWILEMLVHIGMTKPNSPQQISDFLEKKFPVFKEGECLNATIRLIEYMEREEYIYTLQANLKPRKSGKIEPWLLTEKAQSITALTHAKIRSKNTSPIDETLILSLGGPWQSAIITDLSDNTALFLKLFASALPLHPESYVAIVRKLASNISHPTISDALELRARSSTTPEIRKAICESSILVEIKPSLRNILVDLANSDPSQSVKTAARAAARQYFRQPNKKVMTAPGLASPATS